MSPLTTCSGLTDPTRRRGRLGAPWESALPRHSGRQQASTTTALAQATYVCQHLESNGRGDGAKIEQSSVQDPLAQHPPASDQCSARAMRGHTWPARQRHGSSASVKGTASSSRLERPLERGSEAGLEDGRKDSRVPPRGWAARACFSSTTRRSQCTCPGSETNARNGTVTVLHLIEDPEENMVKSVDVLSLYLVYASLQLYESV